MFGERFVRKLVRRYRRRGLDEKSRWLVERLRALGLDGASVLEVGGGIGSISLALLRAGAARALVIELSPAYERAAADLARHEGVAERMGFVLGDLAVDPAVAPPADFVVLHRVVCCSPYGPELLAAAAGQAQRGLVFSYPTRAWWLRLGTWLLNRACAALGREYRMYLHDHARLLAAAEGAGLRPLARVEHPLWRLAAFERI